MVHIREVIEPAQVTSLVCASFTCDWWKSWRSVAGCNRGCFVMQSVVPN
jgi:hypothetical protein